MQHTVSIACADFSLQCASQLVWTGCPVAADDAFQHRYHILNLASDNKFGDTLRIAGTSTDELTRRHQAILHFIVYRT